MKWCRRGRSKAGPARNPRSIIRSGRNWVRGVRKPCPSFVRVFSWGDRVHMPACGTADLRGEIPKIPPDEATSCEKLGYLRNFLYFCSRPHVLCRLYDRRAVPEYGPLPDRVRTNHEAQKVHIAVVALRLFVRDGRAGMGFAHLQMRPDEAARGARMLLLLRIGRGDLRSAGHAGSVLRQPSLHRCQTLHGRLREREIRQTRRAGAAALAGDRVRRACRNDVRLRADRPTANTPCAGGACARRGTARPSRIGLEPSAADARCIPPVEVLTNNGNQ